MDGRKLRVKEASCLSATSLSLFFHRITILGIFVCYTAGNLFHILRACSSLKTIATSKTDSYTE